MSNEHVELRRLAIDFDRNLDEIKDTNRRLKELRAVATYRDNQLIEKVMPSLSGSQNAALLAKCALTEQEVLAKLPVLEQVEREHGQKKRDLVQIVEKLVEAAAVHGLQDTFIQDFKAITHSFKPNAVIRAKGGIRALLAKSCRAETAEWSVAFSKKDIAKRMEVSQATLTADIKAGRIVVEPVSRQRFRVRLTSANRRFFEAPQE